MKCYDICNFFCPYYMIYITICLSLKFLGYSVDMSSNPMKMYLMCVSQYLCVMCVSQNLVYMSDEGCFTFIIHHFVRFMG